MVVIFRILASPKVTLHLLSDSGDRWDEIGGEREKMGRGKWEGGH